MAGVIDRTVNTVDPIFRAVKFKALRKIYPDQPAFRMAEEAQQLLDLKISPVAAVQQCGQAIANINDLQAGRNRLKTDLQAELTGVSEGGISAMARSLTA